MAGDDDKTKGRLKEAGGALTGNDRMKNEGKADQSKGKLKDTAESVRDGASGVVGAARDALGGGKDKDRDKR